MDIRVFDSKLEASAEGARIIASVIHEAAKPVLGLATGSTPVPMYEELIRMYKAGRLSFSGVRSFNLDEYIGLDGTHDQSYRWFMNHNLFDHVDIDKQDTHVPCGTGADHASDAAAYDAMIKEAGGIDVQVLGIGNNGHIGFNEPADVFIRGTHVVDLTDSTIDANTRFFSSRDEVPRQAITMGVGGIMGARKVLLLAFGKAKADAIRATVCGEIDPRVPASILQLHRDAILLLDRDAASLL